jgi:hypothetical protein
MDALKENRRYRREKYNDIIVARKKQQNISKKHRHRRRDTNDDLNYNQSIEFNYVQVSLEILQSLTRNLQLRWIFGKLLRQPDEERARRSMMSSVFWPSLWDGIWKQFAADVPRSNVHVAGKIWHNPHELYQELENLVGPLWARWLCVFLNQSPMADVFSCVTKDVEKRYGTQVILCDGTLDNDKSFDLFVENNANGTEELKIRVLKSFVIRPVGIVDTLTTATVDTEYVVTFYPHTRACLTWIYNHPKNKH